MANPGVEILLRTRNLVTEALKKAANEVKEFGKASVQVSAESAKAMDKLAQSTAEVGRRSEATLKLMERGFKPDAAIKMANAWDASAQKAEVFGEVFGKSLNNSQAAAQGLARQIGVVLPEYVTKFIAQSSTIGPALSGAFSTVAIFGMIGALGQIPEAFKKIEGALTGWDDAAKKAYGSFLDLNRQAVERLDEVEVRMRAAAGSALTGPARDAFDLVGLQNQLATAQGHLTDAKRGAASAAGALPQWSPNAFYTEFGPAPGMKFNSERTVEELKGDIERNKADAETWSARVAELQLKINELSTKGTIADPTKAAADARQAAEARARELQQQRAEEARQRSDLVNRSFHSQDSEVQAGVAVGDRMAQQFLKSVQDQLKEQDFWTKAGQNFKNDSFNMHGDMAKEGLDTADRMAKKFLKDFDEIQKKSEKFIDSFRDGAGHVWDVFTARGTGALAKLGNLASAMFNSIGRSMFQNFSTGLAFGTGIGAKIPGLAQAGGIMGIGSKIPGIGGLFGAGATSYSASASSAIAASAYGTGGATILGMGLTTAIPVFGAIAAGAIFGLSKLFHKKEDPAYFTDPNAERREKTYEFYAANNFQIMNSFIRSIDRFNSIPAGMVVKNGMPQALNSSNQFRRNTASSLNDDDI